MGISEYTFSKRPKFTVRERALYDEATHFSGTRGVECWVSLLIYRMDLPKYVDKQPIVEMLMDEREDDFEVIKTTMLTAKKEGEEFERKFSRIARDSDVPEAEMVGPSRDDFRRESVRKPWS